MTFVTNERALAFLRELEKADAEAAAVLSELDELAAAAEAVRAKAVALEAFGIRHPAEGERVRRALAEAEREARARREAAEEAEKELGAAERARDGGRLAEARRREVRARDAVRMAERKLEAAREEERRLEAEAREAEREREAVDRRARELARALADRPALARHAGEEPGPGPAGAAEWASRARAALFVARGRLTAERESVIRQANELGSLILGEPLGATSAALVARRVERASGGS